MGERRSAWARIKEALRRARQETKHAQPEVLEREWNDMRPARPWDEARDYVRRGWEWSRRKD